MYPLHLDREGEGVGEPVASGFLDYLVLLDWGGTSRSYRRDYSLGRFHGSAVLDSGAV